MIVLDAGDSWQLVRQSDHGDLAGELAAAWGGENAVDPLRADSLALAANRHDDGWAVWELYPRLAPDGRPLPFLEVDIRSHLDFYMAAITDTALQDPYAGVLIGMHAAGLYRERYGTQPGLRNRWADDFGAEIEAFVAKVEAEYNARAKEIGVSEEEMWTDYKLLQVFDRLALYFSGFFKLRNDELHEITPVPLDYEGEVGTLAIKPRADFEPFTPTRVTMDPHPFREQAARFRLERTILPKESWSEPEFVELFKRTPREEVEIVVG